MLRMLLVGLHSAATWHRHASERPPLAWCGPAANAGHRADSSACCTWNYSKVCLWGSFL